MTTGSVAHIPLALGSALAALAGAGVRWCVERFVQAPMATSGIVLVAGLTLMGGANALFMQDARHPAPLFVSGDAGARTATPPPVEPVVVQPVERPEGLTTQSAPAAQPAPQTQTAPAPADTQESRSVGNADIAELQQKLQAMGLFDGTIDGFYGPKTADAIRAFENRFDMPRTGAASPQVLDAVRQAPLNGAQNGAATQQQAPVPPQPAQQQAQAQPQQQQSAAPLFDPSAQTNMVGVAQMGDIGALIEDSEPAARQETTAQESQPMPNRVETAATPSITETVMSLNPLNQEQAAQAVPPSRDRDLVSTVQRGLNRLGFLQAPVNGVADATTARAIRQFQIFHNYRPTGEVTLDLVDMLEAAGAYM